MAPNQENMEGDQTVKSHSHAQQPLQAQTSVQEHCPGETGLLSSVFQAVSEMSRAIITFQSPELSSVGLSRKKQCSYYQERLNLMHATFHCCGTTPSWSVYELFRPPSYICPTKIKLCMYIHACTSQVTKVSITTCNFNTYIHVKHFVINLQKGDNFHNLFVYCTAILWIRNSSLCRQYFKNICFQSCFFVLCFYNATSKHVIIIRRRIQGRKINNKGISPYLESVHVLDYSLNIIMWS